MTAPGASLGEAIDRVLSWGLIAESDIVDGDLTVSSSARRNLNLRIERRRAPGYLIKSADLATGAAEMVSHEAGIYRFCAGEPAAAAVVSAMPPFVGAYESDRVLVLGLVEGARSLWQGYREHGPPELPAAAPRELGRVLGNLHLAFDREIGTAPLPDALREECPGFFGLHEPHPGLLRTASPARLELLRCLQEEPAIWEGLPAARTSWRAETLIHGDVRSENILLTGEAGEPPRLRLVDWEFSQLGDPAWDLAGAFEDHVRFWVDNMSSWPDLDAADRLATARWPLAGIRSSVRAFCDAYAAAQGGTIASLAPTFERAVVFSAARLFQTSWEHCGDLDRLSSLSVLLVQLGANILTDPRTTGHELYGLDLV